MSLTRRALFLGALATPAVAMMPKPPESEVIVARLPYKPIESWWLLWKWTETEYPSLHELHEAVTARLADQPDVRWGIRGPKDWQNKDWHEGRVKWGDVSYFQTIRGIYAGA